MGKYKPVKVTKSAPAVKAGAPCVVVAIGGVLLVFLLLFLVLKYAG